MLGWLRGGAPRSEHGVEADGDHMDYLEPPETPAPVFAIRAFKTAIFGTPQDVERANTQTLSDTDPNSNSFEVGTANAPSTRLLNVGDQAQVAKLNLLKPACSPTKPAGILLTPGTTGARRKTVSFGDSVVDDEGKKIDQGERNVLPKHCPGEFPSPWDRGRGLQGTQARTKLTKALFDVRDADIKARSSQSMSAKTTDRGLQKPETELAHGDLETNPTINDPDMTVDLNDPRSRSGRYWKSEYSSYQDKSNEEMKRLVKYKQMAKSYAKKKDSEATDLSVKLREEREKVAKMEGQVQESAAQIAAIRRSGGSTAHDQAQLMKELARQTALALEYKHRVDEFQAALEGQLPPHCQDHDREAKNNTTPRTDKTLVRAGVELKKAGEGLQELDALRAEIVVYKRKLEEAEINSTRLEEDRAGLRKNLARVKDEMTKYEQRREQKEKQREEKLDLERNKCKQQLIDIELEHQRSHQDLEKAWNEEKFQLKGQISALRAADGADPQSLAWQQLQRKLLQELRQAREESSDLRIENEGLKSQLQEARAVKSDVLKKPGPPMSTFAEESLLDLWTQPEVKNIIQPLRPSLREDSKQEEKGKATVQEPVSLSLALGDRDLNLDAGFAKIQERLSKTYLSPPEKSLDRTHDLRSPSHRSLRQGHSPNKGHNVISPTTKLPNRTNDSPRPSMFNIGSSPPAVGPLSMPLNTAPLHSRHASHAEGRNAGMRRPVGSRVGSLVGGSRRPSVPPDRVAAAKARIEQRNAEKRSQKHHGKENEENHGA